MAHWPGTSADKLALLRAQHRLACGHVVHKSCWETNAAVMNKPVLNCPLCAHPDADAVLMGVMDRFPVKWIRSAEDADSAVLVAAVFPAAALPDGKSFAYLASITSASQDFQHNVLRLTPLAAGLHLAKTAYSPSTAYVVVIFEPNGMFGRKPMMLGATGWFNGAPFDLPADTASI